MILDLKISNQSRGLQPGDIIYILAVISNGLRNPARVVEREDNEGMVNGIIRQKAAVAITRMLDFAVKHDISMKDRGNA